MISFRMYVLFSLVFNVGSFISMVWLDGQAFTMSDPVPSCVALILAGAVVEATKAKTISAAIGLVLAKRGIVGHILAHTMHNLYNESSLYSDYMWVVAVVLNALGVVSLCRRAGSARTAIVVLLLSVFIWRDIHSGFTSTTMRCSDIPSFFSSQDVPIFDGSMPYPPHLPFNRNSRYVKMSDGVSLAVDVYLPRGSHTKKRPTFLHFTRYQRTLKRSMLSRFVTLFDQPPQSTFPMRSIRYIEHFVNDGYAFVTVDTRGAGASEGSKPVDMTPREVQDLKEISDWVLEQAFCDGNIASGGVSYDGMMAAAAAAQGNIKAIGLMGFYGDVYRDVAMIGGIPCKGFGDSYAAFTKASEQNVAVSDPKIRSELPSIFLLMQEMLFDGVAPASTEEIMRVAIGQHRNNYDMAAKSRQENVTCHDDVVAEVNGKSYTWSDISDPDRTIDGLIRNGVSVSTWAGYYDAGSLRASIRTHNKIVQGGGKSRLVQGPWSHGVRKCYTPASGLDRTDPSFPLYYDLKRFVDCELRGIGCGGDLEPGTMHYFITGGDGPDVWRSTRGAFPPNDVSLQWLDMWVQTQNHTLSFSRDDKDDSSSNVVDFHVHNTTTSGLVSRWNLVQHLMKRPVTYEEIHDDELKSGSLTFDSQKLKQSVEIIGSCLIEIKLEALDAHDAVIFAYLEDIDEESNKVHYVTEGQVRASHASKPSNRRPGAIDSVTRSYRRSERRKLEGEITVSIVLEPIAYVFPVNHSIRVRFTGSDSHNFYLGAFDGLATTWRVFQDGTRIRLPVVGGDGASL